MAKRISLQGKGVELFFGGTTSESPVATEERAAKSPTRAHRSASQRPPQADANVRMRARMQSQGVNEEALIRGLGEKQWLASSTFRFQSEELERLDAVFDAVNRVKPRRISKNDLVRLGLRWLLSDYETNVESSLVGKLLERV